MFRWISIKPSLINFLRYLLGSNLSPLLTMAWRWPSYLNQIWRSLLPCIYVTLPQLANVLSRSPWPRRVAPTRMGYFKNSSYVRWFAIYFHKGCLSRDKNYSKLYFVLCLLLYAENNDFSFKRVCLTQSHRTWVRWKKSASRKEKKSKWRG